MHEKGQEMYPSYNVTAQVLQVVDDIALILYVCMLDEFGEVLFPNTYKINKLINEERKKTAPENCVGIDNTWSAEHIEHI